MAASLTTFDGLYKAVLLRCPSASLFLARSWIDIAFRTLWDRRQWSWMRAQTQFFFAQLYNTGTVNVTRGSYTVQGVLTYWSGDLVGRQFRTSINTPIYTIEAVDVTAQTLTLDQPYGGSTATGGYGTGGYGLGGYGGSTSLNIGYQIYNAYQTVPSDFESFLSVIDVNFTWSLGLDTSLEDINRWDPQRSNIGTPYCVVPFDYDGDVFNNPPLPRYEWWPHQQSEYVYSAWFIRRPPDLSDPQAMIPRNVRGNVLLELALAQAARWPGPDAEHRNVYFDLRLAMQHDARGEVGIREMEVVDDSIYETDAWYDSPPNIFIADARWLQRHDA